VSRHLGAWSLKQLATLVPKETKLEQQSAPRVDAPAVNGVAHGGRSVTLQADSRERREDLKNYEPIK
jgi:hypothetical protein